VRLRYTLPALADLESILDYITDRSPQAAQRIQARVQIVIELLLQYPGVGAATDDPRIRRIPTTPYPFLIFFEVTADELIIHAIRHAARDPSDNPGSL
jgi:plasmid stabilization system protein ParE